MVNLNHRQLVETSRSIVRYSLAVLLVSLDTASLEYTATKSAVQFHYKRGTREFDSWHDWFKEDMEERRH